MEKLSVWYKNYDAFLTAYSKADVPGVEAALESGADIRFKDDLFTDHLLDKVDDIHDFDPPGQEKYKTIGRLMIAYGLDPTAYLPMLAESAFSIMSRYLDIQAGGGYVPEYPVARETYYLLELGAYPNFLCYKGDNFSTVLDWYSGDHFKNQGGREQRGYYNPEAIERLRAVGGLRYHELSQEEKYLNTPLDLLYQQSPEAFHRGLSLRQQHQRQIFTYELRDLLRQNCERFYAGEANDLDCVAELCQNNPCMNIYGYSVLGFVHSSTQEGVDKYHPFKPERARYLVELMTKFIPDVQFTKYYMKKATFVDGIAESLPEFVPLLEEQGWHLFETLRQNDQLYEKPPPSYGTSEKIYLYTRYFP